MCAEGLFNSLKIVQSIWWGGGGLTSSIVVRKQPQSIFMKCVTVMILCPCLHDVGGQHEEQALGAAGS